MSKIVKWTVSTHLRWQSWLFGAEYQKIGHVWSAAQKKTTTGHIVTIHFGPAILVIMAVEKGWDAKMPWEES